MLDYPYKVDLGSSITLFKWFSMDLKGWVKVMDEISF